MEGEHRRSPTPSFHPHLDHVDARRALASFTGLRIAEAEARARPARPRSRDAFRVQVSRRRRSPSLGRDCIVPLLGSMSASQTVGARAGGGRARDAARAGVGCRLRAGGGGLARGRPLSWRSPRPGMAPRRALRPGARGARPLGRPRSSVAEHARGRALTWSRRAEAHAVRRDRPASAPVLADAAVAAHQCLREDEALAAARRANDLAPTLLHALLVAALKRAARWRCPRSRRRRRLARSSSPGRSRCC